MGKIEVIQIELLKRLVCLPRRHTANISIILKEEKNIKHTHRKGLSLKREDPQVPRKIMDHWYW